ncbi:XdhC family protein [Sphingomonas jatrophae]|uniref:Xanthine dehydrogenase accessory factor n=1 Tax=Sphingomonas jatrophae TaxID=1166337 RepID=A0A1I6JPF5_9SPHN|nr:XdhC family protein [Sphingomonas jatrophae]SFR80824.1 xanthine dehydrogenase accessory factor [Sphingomonas jatrophae]
MTTPAAELDRLVASARSWRGDGMAIATVVSTWGSAPRPKGSHMLVHADGRFEGSVSGGCVENEILAAAADAIETGTSRLLDFTVADDAAWEAHLPCGGAISVLVQPVAPQGYPPFLFDVLAAARAGGRALTVTTDLASGESRAEDAPGTGRFVNRYAPARRLLIVGAVQIAQALAGFAASLDATATVIDPRERFLTAERFPGVALDSRWPDDAIAAADPGAETAVVTLSHDPKIDDPALIAALAAPTGYVAALGSRRSHAARLDRLRAAGVSESDLARIDGPAGLDIGALGPAEIALSIAAGMVRSFRTRDR